MAIELKWESKKLLVMNYLGRVSGLELLDTTLKLGGDPRFDDLRYILSDWSGIDKADISAEHVKELVAYVTAMSQTNATIKNASVTAKDETGRALVAFYQHLTRSISWQIQYFENTDDARCWFLDVPE
ncbi:MAG: hypothetical protein KUG79_06010 [Pseudomonadales bacterium]|nr:hypothetical protein [Pseudomonadales bacterium]